MIRLTLPTNERCLPFHLVNLFLILFNIGSHIPILLGFPLISNSKYMKGKNILLQFSTTPNLSMLWFFYPYTSQPTHVKFHLRMHFTIIKLLILYSHMNKASYIHYKTFTSIFFFIYFKPSNFCIFTTCLTKLVTPPRQWGIRRVPKGTLPKSSLWLEFLCKTPIN